MMAESDHGDANRWLQAQRQSASMVRVAETVGWTDCGHNAWRTGRVLDPFAGSGTTLVAAHNESRDAIGIDLDDRNVAMVEDRLGPLVAACDLTVLR
jgi:16S rRNA G966 N2-methylase RsmD